MTRSRAALGLLLLSMALLAVLAARRPTPALWGDEGTYLAMAESLGRDGDLRFAAPDLARLGAGEGSAVILERTGRGVSFSKPLLYPLLAAPFVRLLGPGGAVLLNALAVLGALLVVRRRLGAQADLLLATFLGASTLLPLLTWRMAEPLEAALVLAGLALALGEVPRGHAALGALLLGAAVSLRYPNALLALAPSLAALLAARWRRALGLAGAAGVGLGLVLALTFALTGAADPYRATRASFDVRTGYPPDPQALARFDALPILATNTTALRPAAPLRRIAWAGWFFLIGRHAGLVVYLPLFLPLLWIALVRGRRESRAVGIAVLGIIAFYIVWMPENPMGGATTLGNRYIVSAYAALLAAAPAIPATRVLAAVWAIAGLAGGSALASLERAAGREVMSQSHTAAGVFRLLPYESTAMDLDGRRDRYWSGDFLRFVDPFAEVGPASFTLRGGDPAAEIVLATRREPARAQLRVVATARGELRFEAGDAVAGFPVMPAAMTLEAALGRATRRHQFWFEPGAVYDVHVLRLRFAAPAGETLRVRWLDPALPVERALAAEPVSLDLPATAPAGSLGEVVARLRNTSGAVWSSLAPLELRLAARVDLAGEGAHAPLPGEVRPGEQVEVRLPVRWPRLPGRARIVIDLVAEDFAWLAERRGAPLFAGEVEVLAAGPIPR